MQFVGLLVYDLLLLAVGASVLVALRPRIALRRLGPWAGLAFWLGLSTVGLVCSFVAELGPAPSRLGVALVAVAGCAVAVWRRRLAGPETAPVPAARPLGWPAALVYAGVGVVGAAELAAGWYRPAFEWDGWAFWIPRARLLFETGHLHANVWTQFSGTTYPPLVPVVHAGAFAFMGAANEVLLHVQAALFLLAFVQAVAVIGRRHAPDLYVAPFVLLVVSLPAVSQYAIQLDADYPTEFLFVLGTVLCAGYLLDGRRAALIPAALLLAATANSRREGLIYAAAVGAAGLAAGALRGRRHALWLLAPSAFALGAAVPWLTWVRLHHVVADSVPPPALIGSTGNTSAAGAAGHGLGVVLDYVFRFGSWSVAPYIGFAVLGLALLAWRRDRGVAPFVVVTVLILVGAMVWRLLWYGGGLNPAGTPIPRISGVLSLLLLAVAPLLLATSVADVHEPAWLRGRARYAGLAAAFVLLPPVVLLGVEGAHLHAVRSVCNPQPSTGGAAYVVFGYPHDYASALRLRDTVAARGFGNAELGVTLCGRLRVQAGPVASVDLAQQLQAKAAGEGLATSLTGG